MYKHQESQLGRELRSPTKHSDGHTSACKYLQAVFTHTDTFRPLTRPRGHKLPVTTNLEDCKLPTPSSSSSSTTPLFYLHNEIVLSHSLPPSLPDLKTAQTLSSPSCSSAILPSFLQSRAAEDRQITDRRRTHPTRPDRPCHIPGSRKKRIS